MPKNKQKDYRDAMKGTVHKCSKHKGWDLELHCNKCSEPVCIKCALLEHEGHSKQDLETVTDTPGGIPSLAPVQSAKLMIRQNGLFGLPGTGSVKGVGFTSDDNIGLFRGGRILVYRLNGLKLSEFNFRGQVAPRQVVCAGNTILVADTENGSILQYGPDGSYLSCIYNHEEKMDDKVSLSVQDNKLFIAARNTIFLMDWQQAGKIEAFVKGNDNVEIEKVAFMTANANKVAVACKNSTGNVVHVFDSSGRHLFTYTGKGSPADKIAYTSGLVLDAKGRLLVCDRDHSIIHIVSNKGRYLGKINLKKDNLSNPEGMAISSQGELIVTVDQKYDPLEKAVATYKYVYTFE